MIEKTSNRSVRISRELQKEIALIIQYSLKDPRIKTIITVSAVKVSKDLSHARVFVSFLRQNDQLTTKNLLLILNKSIGYIRKLLCKKIKLRIIPNIIFYKDDSYLIGNKISSILEKLEKRKKNTFTCGVNKR